MTITPEVLASLDPKTREAVEGLQAENERLRTAVRGPLIESQAKAAIAAAGGDAGLLAPHILDRARISEHDGGLVVEIVNDDGNVRFNNDGSPMTIEDRVRELKGDRRFGAAFGGTNGGSGSAGPRQITRAEFAEANVATIDAVARGEVAVVD